MDELFRQIEFVLNYTNELLFGALVLARTVPMIFLTPFLGGKIAPPEVKMGLGVLLAILIWPLARGALTGPVPTNALGFLLLMVKEVFVGLVIGFINAHVFYAMDMAGRLIDTVRGTSMSEVQDPHSKQRVTPVGDLYTQLFLVIFVVIGGHHIFFEMFFFSFVALPVNSTLPTGVVSAGFFDRVVELTAQLLLIATVLAAPIIAATFISDVVFGILNRVAPQLNAYFMSMPVKAMAGVVMIFVALGAIVERFEDYVVWTLEAVQDILARMGALG